MTTIRLIAPFRVGALVLAWIFLVSIAVAGFSFAQNAQTCKILKGHAASFLQQCGDQLHSFTLALRDARRTPTGDMHGFYYFECRVEPGCKNEPNIYGWFIDSKSWLDSARDEHAIFELMQQRGPWRMVGRLDSACGVFDIDLAGAPARAACLTVDSSSLVIAIGANGEVGFVLVFAGRDMGLVSLREKVLTILPKFHVERASGDAGLLKWIIPEREGTPERAGTILDQLRQNEGGRR